MQIKSNIYIDYLYMDSSQIYSTPSADMNALTIAVNVLFTFIPRTMFLQKMLFFKKKLA